MSLELPEGADFWGPFVGVMRAIDGSFAHSVIKSGPGVAMVCQRAILATWAGLSLDTSLTPASFLWRARGKAWKLDRRSLVPQEWPKGQQDEIGDMLLPRR